MNSQKGFTLIELMITVAVVGILASIAVPAYSNYVKRGKIAEATSKLSARRVQMEQYYLDNRTYLNTNSGWPCDDISLAKDKTENFSFDCPDITSLRYTLRAQGQGSMSGFVYTVDQGYNKSTTITNVSGWAGNGTCWVTKTGGAC